MELHSLIVMPRFMRGIQYAVMSRNRNELSGILDRPVKPGDDTRVSGLKTESEQRHIVRDAMARRAIFSAPREYDPGFYGSKRLSKGRFFTLR